MGIYKIAARSAAQNRCGPIPIGTTEEAAEKLGKADSSAAEARLGMTNLKDLLARVNSSLFT